MSMTQDQADGLRFIEDFFALPVPRSGQMPTASLCGYAGVGKTWLLGHAVDAELDRHPDKRIIVAAPTNKAVDVLRGKITNPAVRFATLDSLLGYRVKRNEDRQMERTKFGKTAECDALLVDEGSMVKKDMYEELQWQGFPVLFSGDPAQLQPINEDVSLALTCQRRFEMREVVRQAKDNPINQLATYFRDVIENGGLFTLPSLRDMLPRDPRISFTSMRNVYGWAEGALDKGLDAVVLAFTNAAVWQHNQTMHARRYPDAPLFGVGELALVNETFEVNDDTLLTNGEVVRVVNCERADDIAGVEVYAVEFARLGNNSIKVKHADGSEETLATTVVKVALDEGAATRAHKDLTNRIYEARNAGRMGEYDKLLEERRPLNKLAPLRHSYARTLHKAQGSTHDVALLDFSDIYKARDMRARLMYVGATRPSQFLVMGHTL